MMYVGLDLSAAFDSFDHQFLFEILVKRIGLQSVVLLFIMNYRSHRSQQIMINGCLSGDVKVKTGVPQGSVLGPLHFSCYMLPLEDKLKELGIKFSTQIIPFFILYSVRPSLKSCLIIF